MNPLNSLADYENFVYSLPQQFPTIVYSTLLVARRSVGVVAVTGEIIFSRGFRLVIEERLMLNDASLEIVSYGYEVWQGTEKLYWYDSQPHPNDPTLASTHPHHKHVPPDIKHNRIPAPGLSFTEPNIDFLIKEIEDDLLSDSSSNGEAS